MAIGAALLLLLLASVLPAVKVSAQEEPSIKVQARNLKITNIFASPAHTIPPTYDVIGRIVNNSSKSFDTVTIVGEFYDSSGKLVGVERSYSELSLHANGGTSPFKMQVFVPTENLKLSNIVLTIKEDF
jgi:hypothetical protein